MVYDLQKGSMWKRISAFLFDFIIMTVITAVVITTVTTIIKRSRSNVCC